MRLQASKVKAMSRSLTVEEFVEKARKMHGDRFDYSRVNYINGKTNVEIVCQENHSFFQRPQHHMSGSKCPECSHKSRAVTHLLTVEEFMEKARKVHGDKFDYSGVTYVDCRSHVEIVCQENHSFLQQPRHHLSGSKCPECSGRKQGDTASFVSEAREVHGDVFDYSRVRYTNCLSKVEIVCPLGHIFRQTPSGHLQGKGCPQCVANRKSDTTEFLEKAVSKYGDKFDYSRVEYVKSCLKVEIVCPNGHVFFQTPNKHLMGRGCDQCRRIFQRGETHPNWKPSRTDEDRARRRQLKNSELNYWRGAVFGRDNSTCQKCHAVRGELNAHHILPWSKFPEVRFDIDNGITFCRACHQEYHSRYKLAECNHKTIAEFLAANASTITIDLLSSQHN